MYLFLLMLFITLNSINYQYVFTFGRLFFNIIVTSLKNSQSVETVATLAGYYLILRKHKILRLSAIFLDCI